MKLYEVLEFAGYIKPNWSNRKIYLEIFEIKSLADEEWREFDSTRAVLTRKGRLFVADADGPIHEDILTALGFEDTGWERSYASLEKFLCLYSEWKYDFTLAESYDDGMIEAIEEDYLEIYNKLIKKISPKFNIELEKEYYPRS